MMMMMITMMVMMMILKTSFNKRQSKTVFMAISTIHSVQKQLLQLFLNTSLPNDLLPTHYVKSSNKLYSTSLK